MAQPRTGPVSSPDPVTGVKTFYDREGWQWVDGQSGDARRWGTAPRGPVQRRLHEHRIALLRRVLGFGGDGRASEGRDVALVELGGGGQPVVRLLDGVRSYTAVDVSGAGLEAARAALEPLGIGAALVKADVRSLPLADGRFDVGYSAHMLYHLPTADDQRRALCEMVRVVRPGGALAVVTANPYPWLFLARCVRRAIADVPPLAALANGLRPPPPLPYLPMPATWICEVLAPFGTTEVRPFGVPTTAFVRRVGEERPGGRALWQAVYRLETRHPELALRGGAFVLVVLRKAGG